ncbi:response regulator [Hahella sp. SMD15-11]|uniref:Response regulator n=1 Tax=Thermohahella caldifontis TaxID=3142973 RepID=A0AB39UVG5_9GAMM
MNRKILIVDDSQTDLTYLANIVRDAGFTPILASDGAEAVARARQEKPGMILMDIIMDGMDGFAACREITHDPALKDIPVVFVSSKKQKADHLWALKQGARALISKPYEQTQIVTEIERYCA